MRNKQLLLGIDFGTGGCKISLIDFAGNVRAEASKDYPTWHPHPSYSEQHPGDWFPALVHCLNAIKDKVALGSIAAISLDGSTHNAVLLDQQMRVIRPTIMWSDQRSVAEVAYLQKHHGEQIYKIGYQKVAPTWTLPQLLWIKNNEPENFARIDKIMFVKDYVRYLLTGTWETDFIDAQGSLLFDVKENVWSPELCGLLGLPLRVLPPICMPTDITGQITLEAARLTGLPEGTRVVCGTSDVTAEDYGAGAIHPGQCVIKLATAGNLNVMTAGAKPSPFTLTYAHVVPGLWYTASATNAAASAMRWFRDVFCAEEQQQAQDTGKNVYQLMEEGLSLIPPGSEGLLFHPYLIGERAPYWDAALRASFVGATMAHTKAHFVKAVMEGVAFSLKDCLQLVEQMDLRIDEYILIGGGAKSETWAQLICDVFGKKVSRPLVTDASFGTAMIAGVGIGVFSSPTAAVQKCVRYEKTLIPDPNNQQTYERYFGYYKIVQERMQEVYHAMKTGELTNAAGRI